jgi:hypothetical protein
MVHDNLSLSLVCINRHPRPLLVFPPPCLTVDSYLAEPPSKRQYTSTYALLAASSSPLPPYSLPVPHHAYAMAPSPVAGAHGEGASAGAVCCMCGDRGLPGELFRCRCCRSRLQHRYCSDLYPRAAAYRRCNWCLREPGPGVGQAGLGHAHAAAVFAANNKPEDDKQRKTTAAASDEERRLRHDHDGCSPSPKRLSPPRPPAELGHPVKKKHRAEEKTPQPPPAVAANNRPEDDKRKTTAAASDEERPRQRHEGCSPTLRKSSPPPAELVHPVKKKHRAEEKTPPAVAGKVRVNRVCRVRRYKLLAEVISC